MSFNASTFKSNLVSAGGGARPSLFKIILESSLAGVSGIDGSDAFLVKAAAMPASNIAPLAVNYAGRAYKWHGFRTYDLWTCLLYTSPSPRDATLSRMPSSA